MNYGATKYYIRRISDKKFYEFIKVNKNGFIEYNMRENLNVFYLSSELYGLIRHVSHYDQKFFCKLLKECEVLVYNEDEFVKTISFKNYFKHLCLKQKLREL